METRNPNDLLTYKRFDVVVKYMYASNLSSEFFKNAYKEHLGIWNGFTEDKRKKSTFEDFDNAFKSIINNTVDEPVPVNPEGHIANGAHRLAAALYHQRPINIRNTNSDENNYIERDYKVFLRKGLARHIRKRTALEYAKLKSNTHVVCLFPDIGTHSYVDRTRPLRCDSNECCWFIIISISADAQERRGGGASSSIAASCLVGRLLFMLKGDVPSLLG